MPRALRSDLHGRLGERRLVVGDPLLHVHPVAVDVEERLRPTGRAAHQEVERRLGDIERVSCGLPPLDLIDRLRDRGVVERDTELVGLHADRRSAAVVRGDHATTVPDDPGVDVLVGAGHARDAAGVQAGLVGERMPARVRLMRVGSDVCDLGDVVRELGEMLHRAGGEGVRDAHLQHEVRGDRDQVGVAGPFAVAVDGALHLEDPRIDGDQRVRDRAPRVVVDVDPERHARPFADRRDDPGHVEREHPAVRVA